MSSSVEDAMNPWEVPAYRSTKIHGNNIFHDTVYAPSEQDVMRIIVPVYGRPNPKFDLGAVDFSSPIIICDLDHKDHPIAYVNAAFYEVTGYSPDKVIGKNCRFLQAPGGKVKPGSTREHVDRKSIRRMRKCVDDRSELQIRVVNFKKDGTRFVNIVSMISTIYQGRNLCVGFLYEEPPYE